MHTVIVVTLAAERIAATVQSTVGTNRCTAVGALRNGRLAAKPSIITMARHVFDLAVRHVRPPDKLAHKNASREQVRCDVPAQIVFLDLPSATNEDF